MYFWSIAPTPIITTYANGPLETTKVGYLQLIGCRVALIRGVELSDVKFTWTGPTGSTITNTSRVTISLPYLIQNGYHDGYHGDLRFEYLREGDEGVYTCTVAILNTTRSASLNIDPLPSRLTKNLPISLCRVHAKKIHVLMYNMMFHV